MSDLQVFTLADVLARLPVPLSPGETATLSRKWRCVIAPRLAGPTAAAVEKEAFAYLERTSTPVFLTKAYSEDSCAACGDDARAFLRDPRWHQFPKPQIAVRSGWGSPGTTLESSDFHKMIGAFDEVFEHRAAAEIPLTEEERAKEAEAKADAEKEEAESAEQEKVVLPPVPVPPVTGEVLEMQLFHRDDPGRCPALPPLGNQLRWPAFLDDTAAVICDVDTVVSQRGAQRWWRLNDSGELVMQTALPAAAVAHQGPASAAPAATRPAAASIDAALYGKATAAAAARKPVRLLIFGPKGSYDWFVHDDESTTRGRIACMDIFNLPDEALPFDETLLPILTVAVLEAGGPPLLVPPNLPCLTLTLNDCVVVGQRRISHTLWLDEVSYFLSRTAHWASAPLIYKFIDKDLQDAEYVTADLVPSLMELFRRHSARNPYEEGIRRRVAVSLFTIAAQEKHYNMAEGSRASLTSHLTADPDLSAILHAAASSHSYCFLASQTAPLSDAVRLYWDVKAWWPRAGCVMKPPLLARDARRYSAEALAAEEIFLPVVYSQYRPIFGTEKTTLQGTVGEYFEMKDLERKPRPLLTYLRSCKQARDDILDELF